MLSRVFKLLRIRLSGTQVEARPFGFDCLSLSFLRFGLTLCHGSDFWFKALTEQCPFLFNILRFWTKAAVCVCLCKGVKGEGEEARLLVHSVRAQLKQHFLGLFFFRWQPLHGGQFRHFEFYGIPVTYRCICRVNTPVLLLKRHALTLSFLRVVNVKFLLQPHQKYYITQYGELGFS